MDQQLYERIQELQHASYFRTKADNGGDRIVNAPFLGSPIASAFERLSRFDDPSVEIGRLGVHEVHAICWGIDAVQDGVSLIDDIPALTREGAINVRRMSGGRC